MKKILFSLMMLFASHFALAQNSTDSKLTVEHAWSRSTAAQAPTGAAYLTIQNAGSTADQLLSVSGSVAETIQMHRTTVDNGVMHMREVTGGLDIPAKQSVTFAPGGLHIMLISLKKPLMAGEHFPLTLHFAHAGDKTVEVQVKNAAGAMPGMSMHN